MAAAPHLDDRVTRVVFEALEAVASPELAIDIVADALTHMELEGPPASPALLRRFVADHLWPAVVARLGVEAADAVGDRLRQVADSWELSDSHVRRKRNDTLDYSEPPAPGARSPLGILLVTSDPGLADDIGRGMADRASVTVVGDSLELLRQLEDVSESRSVLVVDCLTSPIPLDSLVTSAPHLPEETPVLLWRAGEPVDLGAVPRSRALRWSLLRPPSDLDDLVTTLGRLVAP